MAKTGRKSKYETVIKPKEKEILELAKQGYTDKEIAKHLGIGYSTWKNHKGKIKDFQDLLLDSRQKPVEELENRAFKSAMGFTKKVKKAMKLKEVTYKDGKREKEIERMEYYEEEVYIPPSTNMQQFLLKNWKKEKYSNNPAELEVKKQEFDLNKKIKEQDIF